MHNKDSSLVDIVVVVVDMVDDYIERLVNYFASIDFVDDVVDDCFCYLIEDKLQKEMMNQLLVLMKLNSLPFLF